LGGRGGGGSVYHSSRVQLNHAISIKRTNPSTIMLSFPFFPASSAIIARSTVSIPWNKRQLHAEI